MPSTTSSSVSSDFASSTVMTPSLPTFFMASARNLPISTSPLEEMVPTWAISSFEVTFLEFLTRSATPASTARSIPRFRSIGFMPAATDLAPSRTIAAASTVAVVVPSPAASAALEATSRTIWAPMFSNLSSSSISLATVTPSLVMRGAPNDLSSTTLRPLGPSVTFTALLRMSTPRSILSRASTPNLTSLLAMMCSLKCWVIRRLCSLLLGGRQIGENAHDVALLHDQEFLAVELDLGARPFAEQHAVADLEVARDQLPGFVAAGRADRRDFALRGLFLGAVGNDDPALGLFFGVDTFDHDTVMQRTKFRFSHDGSFWRLGFQIWFAIESGSEYGRIRHRQGAKQLASLAISLSEC